MKTLRDAVGDYIETLTGLGPWLLSVLTACAAIFAAAGAWTMGVLLFMVAAAAYTRGQNSVLRDEVEKWTRVREEYEKLVAKLRADQDAGDA